MSEEMSEEDFFNKLSEPTYTWSGKSGNRDEHISFLRRLAHDGLLIECFKKKAAGVAFFIVDRPFKLEVNGVTKTFKKYDRLDSFSMYMWELQEYLDEKSDVLLKRRWIVPER